jgi:hypothetical protein
MVLGLMGLIIFGLWIRNSTASIGENVHKDICKQSVRMHAAANIKGVNFNSQTLNCPTQNLTIPKKYSDEDAKKAIAVAMADCWDQYHEGRLELFGAEGTYCAICNFVEFEEKGNTIPGMMQYLMDEDAPGKQMSYISYFQGFESDRSDWLRDELRKKKPNFENDLMVYNLDTDKTYTITFVYVKGSNNIRKAGEYIQNLMQNPATAGAAFGVIVAGAAVVGVTGPISAIMAIPGLITGGTLFTQFAFLSGFTTLMVTDTEDDYLSYISLREFSADALTDLNCEYMPVK